MIGSRTLFACSGPILRSHAVPSGWRLLPFCSHAPAADTHRLRADKGILSHYADRPDSRCWRPGRRRVPPGPAQHSRRLASALRLPFGLQILAKNATGRVRDKPSYDSLDGSTDLSGYETTEILRSSLAGVVAGPGGGGRTMRVAGAYLP